jgi:transcriptional regulator with XRE-family HTH domain
VTSDTGGTDVGRRITDERHRAGLSRDETATRAGMAPDYLTYLETSALPTPSHATLARLAAAIGVPVSTLTGAGLDLPPGQTHAAVHPRLTDLTLEECRARLAPGGVGRFLFEADRGPVAVPVNFRMLGDDVVFRSQAQGDVIDATRQARVSFDVDHIDAAFSEGWSVLLSGTARVLTDPAEIQQAVALDIDPWPGGERNTYIRLTPAEITGKRLREAR